MEFTYKGKKIKIEETHPDAVISVDGREFACHHHHAEGENGLAAWMCDETYFASPDIRELAKHFADYGYMFDDPNRIRVNDDGEVVPVDTTRRDRPDTDGDASGHGGHGSDEDR